MKIKQKSCVTVTFENGRELDTFSTLIMLAATYLEEPPTGYNDREEKQMKKMIKQIQENI